MAKAMKAKSATRDFLVEIGCEELPPKALRRLSEAFGAGIRAGLAKAGLVHGELRLFATPRRLAVRVEALPAAQPDRVIERRGPALNAAFDAAGQPSRAALGFAQSCGVSIEALERLETDKGAWLVHRQKERGQPVARLLPGIVADALDQLPIPKRMRWADLDVAFVRPVHWVVMLYGAQVVSGEILGLKAGKLTRGHRFLCPKPITLTSAADYEHALQTKGRVIADYDARRAAVLREVEAAARSVKAVADIDDALLEEVVALVEWPVGIVGSFDKAFLRVPAEALVSTMQGNQKYFPLRDRSGQMRPQFVAVTNLPSRKPEFVRAGNERVIRPRFADAAFFWDQDRKQPLEARRAALGRVVFQDKLGSLEDKTARVETLAAKIAPVVGADPARAARAAGLAKCDLMTAMVGEFPELQGIMGRYYALAAGEDAEVADALEDQYRPRFAGDGLPATPAGQALALADKLDTLVGIFAIGQAPTGDKDPFALRRAALGLLRTLIERGLNLDLRVALGWAAEAYPASLGAERTVDAVFAFVMDRARAYYADAGVAPDVFEAVLARTPSRPLDFDARIKAVSAFRQLPEAEALAAANKRVRNILRQAGVDDALGVEDRLLQEGAERVLAERLHAMQGTLAPLLKAGDYAGAMRALATLREPIDRFFEDVMVMVEDEAVRRNRLALLAAMSTLFLRIADLSRLQG